MIKNKALYITGGMLGVVAIVMIAGAALGRAAVDANTVPTSADDFVSSFCFGGKVDTMGVSDLVNVYTQATNDYFNKQILKLMSNPEDAVPTPYLNKYSSDGGGLCSSTGQGDLTCKSIAICNPAQSNPANDLSINPYCMGVTLLGVVPAKFDHYDYAKLKKILPLPTSYFCYTAALDKKRNDIYDGTPYGILQKCGTSEFADQDICKLNDQIIAETDPAKQAALRDELAYQLNQKGSWSSSFRGAVSSLTANIIDITDASAKKLAFIDREEARAKAALDQALDAYSQMRFFWQLHTRYMDIFSELVKYRDHLVAIRKNTDAFPLRFIDATTTKCL